jgi:N-acetylmuramoyl-L-alanine amidase
MPKSVSRSRIAGVFGPAFGVAAALGLTLPALGAAPDRFDTVIVDAGHGGDDEGAVSPGGLYEKDLVLAVAKQLARRLAAAGVSVVLTRSDDTFIPLEQRTSIANDARGDLFVSIHANATRDPDVRGIETFFMALDASDDHASRVARRENRAFGERKGPAQPGDDALMAIIGDLISTGHMEESNEFARLAQAELAAGSELGRGVKQAPFVVLEAVQMPASLVEIGFLTNRSDATEMSSEAGRQRIVDALVRATLEFGRRYDLRRGIGTR